MKKGKQGRKKTEEGKGDKGMSWEMNREGERR